MSNLIKEQHDRAAELLCTHGKAEHAVDLADYGTICSTTAHALEYCLQNGLGTNVQQVAARQILARTPGFQERYRDGASALPKSFQPA